MKRLMTGCIMAALILSCATVSASARHGCMDTVCGGFSIGCGPAVCVSQERVRLHSCVDEDGDGICDNYDPDRCPGYGSGNGMGYGNGGHHGGGRGHHGGRHC